MFQQVKSGPLTVTGFLTSGTFKGPGNEIQLPRVRVHLCDRSSGYPVEEVFDKALDEQLTFLSDEAFRSWLLALVSEEIASPSGKEILAKEMVA